MEDRALAALDVDGLARDATALVRVPSVTGDDLAALRAGAGHPGEEAPRDALWGLTATLEGQTSGRLCLNGHVDVVGPGSVEWRLGPWSGALEDGRVYGR